MPGFDELQALWQAQPTRAARASEIEALRHSLREYGRRMNRIYIAKAAAIPLVIFLATNFSHPSRAALAALAAVMVVAVTMLAADWRNQRAIASLDFSSVSLQFVRRAIDRLSAQRDAFGKSYWLIFAALALFENVWVESMPHGQRTLPATILWHLGATAFPFAALEVGRRVRLWRFNRECRPIIERLAAIEKSLREEAE